MQLTVFPTAQSAAFFALANRLYQSQPIYSNLPWGLALNYINDGAQLQQMLVIEEEGNVTYVGLQTDSDRPFILIGPIVASIEAKELLKDHIYQAAGIIAQYELAMSLKETFRSSFKIWESMLLYKLEALSKSVNLDGNLIKPDDSHQELIAKWIEAFLIDVNQVGGTSNYQDRAKSMIDKGDLRLLLEDGDIVSMSASTRSAGGVACINYVYTPPSLRGKGFSTKCVGLHCQELLTTHQACCLYAEEDNPISNHVYQKLGFEVLGRSLEVGW